MSNQNDIFKNLGEYEANPPQEVVLNIFKAPDIDKQTQEEAALKKQFEQLQELEINPPVNAFTFIKNKIASSFKLTFLQEKEIVPPTATYTSILKKIALNTRKDYSSGNGVTRTIYQYRAVAATLIIVLIGWFIYKSAGSPNKKPADIAKMTPIIPASIKNDSIIKTTTDDVVTVSAAKDAVATTENYFNNRRMSVNDYNFSVINNDLLATFAGFTYEQVPSFIESDDSKKFTIRTDQYTAITVSESMSNMIGKMNRFRRNEKLTRGAKRTRATLEKWKKADAERFDASTVNNPLDAVDLARFIFN